MRHGNERQLTWKSNRSYEVAVCRRERVKEPLHPNSDHSLPLHSIDLGLRLERLADTRRSVVARGKMLIAQPNYPDRATIRGVAQVLARSWTA